MTPVILAMVAAVFIGAGAAWQQVVAAEDPGDKSMVDPRLLLRLLRRKKWLIGFALANGGFACQASAIATGRLVLVEPIAATNVLFALLVSARHSHRSLGRREWRGATFAIVGVGGFLALAAPKEGADAPPSVPWFVPLAILAVAMVIGLGIARRLADVNHRALTIAVLSGIGFGTADALLKLFTDVASKEGIGGMLTHWSPYTWLIVSPLAFLLQQTAFRTAHLGASMPATSTLAPLTAAGLGAVMFHEQIRGGWAIPGELVLGVVMLVGVALLASSPLIEVEVDPDANPDADPEPEPATSP